MYTPPVLPSPITIALKPIVGVPSDEETQLVHAAMSSWEHLKHGKLQVFLVVGMH